MPDIVIFSDTVTTTTQDLGSSSFQVFFLKSDVALVNTSFDAITGSGSSQQFIVNGDVFSDSEGLVSSGNFATISVGGSIASTREAIVSTGDNAQIDVNGSIISADNGIEAQGNLARIIVSQNGSIVGNLSSGVRLGPLGANNTVEFSSLTNAGTITGNSFGVGVITNGVINNSGTIAKSGVNNTGVGAAAIGFFASFAKELKVNNSGDIIGSAYVETSSGTLQPAEGIFVRDGQGNSLELLNSGNIVGRVTAADGADRVVNSGEIVGDVSLGDADDTMVNTGTVSGVVGLGEGDDTFTGSGAGIVSGLVSGDSGNDTMRGGEAADEFDGGANNDFLTGRSGDDTLFGGTGEDTVIGGAGDDVLFGDSGNDVLNGQGGNDAINGGFGDDRMRGGNGDDTLTPGSGSDILRGDAGQDVFVFDSVTDTGTGATRDRIIGWEDGADLIDLSGFGALTFSAMGAVGSGTASVWFEAVSGGAQTMLRIDSDGDGTFDGQVLLVRADPALFDKSDLILA
ncbi:MAG: calcium-binding protein [Pseudomonadota bacterium]